MGQEFAVPKWELRPHREFGTTTGARMPAAGHFRSGSFSGSEPQTVSGVKRAKAVKHIKGLSSESSIAFQEAEAMCLRLEGQADISQCIDPEVRRSVASAASTPAETLASLSNDTDVKTRINVAKSGNTDMTTLEELSHDPVDGVREAVARNPNTSEQVLAALEGDRIGSVSSAVRDARAIR